jgi:hypothetical protein
LSQIKTPQNRDEDTNVNLSGVKPRTVASTACTVLTTEQKQPAVREILVKSDQMDSPRKTLNCWKMVVEPDADFLSDDYSGQLPEEFLMTRIEETDDKLVGALFKRNGETKETLTIEKTDGVAWEEEVVIIKSLSLKDRIIRELKSILHGSPSPTA